VSPSGPVSVGTVAPGRSASETFTVATPSSALSAGAVSLPASAGYDGASRRLLQSATVSVPSTSLAATFNNTGITDNSDPSPTSGFIGFDGEGTSYSAEGLAADGVTPGSTVSSGGVSFTWPDVANVALESGKTVEAVTLPDLGSVAGYNPALHVFAMAIGR
jgi:hypothetical protein